MNRNYKFRPVNHRRNYVFRAAYALVEFPAVELLRSSLRNAIAIGDAGGCFGSHFGLGRSRKEREESPQTRGQRSKGRYCDWYLKSRDKESK